jgi:predicted Zn finger-like uncharacterized protein
VLEEPKMILLCPNCGAQYEVPEDHIPKKYGRDVQCSACNHTWFQTHPAQDLQPILQDETVANDLASDRRDSSEPPEADDPSSVAAAPSAGAGPQMPPLRQKRSLHPSIADVLREEAKREVEERGGKSARLSDSPAAFQSTGEIPSSRTAQSGSSDQARDADMDMQALEALYQNSEKTAKSTRGALLPDIDEINSTLSTSSTEWPSDSDAAIATTQKGQRRLGFLVGIAIIIAAAALYYYADTLGDQIPSWKEPLELYQQWVNTMRIGLDQWIRQAIDWLQTQWAVLRAPTR